MSKRDSKILSLFSQIEAIKEGKGDLETLGAYVADIRIYRLFVWQARQADSKQEFENLVSQFENWIDCRQREDWMPHSRSKNDYSRLFRGY